MLTTLAKTLGLILLLWGALELLVLLAISAYSFYWHRLAPECDKLQRYGGPGSFVVITGGSSGQGKFFALEFARRGFNLLLVGSKRSFDVQREIQQTCPERDVRVVLCDFCHAFEPDFWTPICAALDALPPLALAGLVNNVGHRVGWEALATMPPELIHNTIACGTVTQARMTREVLARLRARAEHRPAARAFVLSITAQCVHHSMFLGRAAPPVLSTPFIGVYEASNAFGYFLACTLAEEARLTGEALHVDHLVIAPGAVLTSNTRTLLDGTIGAIEARQFVVNVMWLLGNVTGAWSGSWVQGALLYTASLVPPFKRHVLAKTGARIAQGLMRRDQRLARPTNAAGEEHTAM